MRKIWLIIATVFSAACVASAGYSNTESTMLFKNKAWEVAHKYFTATGAQTCYANSWNEAHGDLFQLEVVEDGAVLLMIASDRKLWRSKFQDNLVLAIDDEKWTLNDAQFDVVRGTSRVVFWFEPGSDFQRFLRQLFNGRSVALLDAQASSELVNWSLAGSAAALLKLTECSERIGAMNHIPSISGYGIRSGYGGN